MAKHAKKGGNQDLTLKIIVLVTAILNLVKALVDIIKSLTGQGRGRKPPHLQDMRKGRCCQQITRRLSHDEHNSIRCLRDIESDSAGAGDKEVEEMSVGANIRTLREAAGLSQAYVAAQAGISQAMLCQIERGTKNPSLQVSKEISAVLCCKLDDLLDDQQKDA